MDELGHGHHMDFSIECEKEMDKFVAAILPLAALGVSVYKVTKEQL